MINLFNNPRKQSAFTLVELLVVVAVLALLASIVFSNLTGAREQAKISNALSFQSNMHNLLGADLVGWWKFDESLNDISGYNNHAIYSGSGSPIFVNDTPEGRGYSLQLNGNIQYGEIHIPLQNVSHEAGTLAFWFKIPSGYPYDRNDIWISTANAYSGSNSLNMQTNLSYPERVVGFHWSTPDGTGYNHYTFNYNEPNFIEKNWNHLLITWSENTGYFIYINGSLIGSRTTDTPLRSFDDDYLRIKGSGDILYSEIMIYSRMFNAMESIMFYSLKL